MARGGLYKSDVQKARATLLVQGKHPSIDALRVALGNTGSKTTIHRYLKELEEEEGAGVGAKVAVSDALQDLIGRLAGRLHEEAERSEEHTSELQSLMRISYAVFCLKKKKKKHRRKHIQHEHS